MARRRGTIQKRGTNRYLVRVYAGLVGGKRKYVSKMVKGSRDEAEAELTRILREMDTRSFVEPSKETVQGFLEKWVEGKKHELETTSYLDYKARLRLDVYPDLGDTRIQDLQPSHIKQLYTKLLEERGLAPSTVIYTHTILKQGLEQALQWGLIHKNPAALVKPPKKKRVVQIQPLTPEETRKVLEWAEKHQPLYYPLYTLLVTTGMRPGEALALTWDDIDLEDGVVYVRRSRTRISNGQWTTKEYPKTQAGRRSITLPKTTVRVLKEHRRAQAERLLSYGIRTDLVFATTKGTNLHLMTVRRNWAPACKGAGIPRVRIYDLRHTHATQLLMAGVNPKVVSERLGHANIQMTLDTYSHVLPSLQTETADKVEAALFG